MSSLNDDNEDFFIMDGIQYFPPTEDSPEQSVDGSLCSDDQDSAPFPRCASSLTSLPEENGDDSPCNSNQDNALFCSTGIIEEKSDISSNKELPPKVSLPKQISNEHNLKNVIVLLPKVSEAVIKTAKKEGVKVIEGKDEDNSKEKFSLSNSDKINRTSFESNNGFDQTPEPQKTNKAFEPFVQIHNFHEVLKDINPLHLEERNILNQNNPSNSNIIKPIKRNVVENGETEVAFVQERNLRKEADKTRETHTVEDNDSDSDICIIKEKISEQSSVGSKEGKRGRGRPRLNHDAGNRRMFGSRILQCSECNFKTPYLSQLRIHEAAHPKGRKMKCSICPFETRIKSCMMYHAVIHSGGKKYKCSKCSFKTNNIELFIAHENKKAYCSYCKKDCHTRRDLNTHLKKYHNVDIFQCQLCIFSTPDAKEMESHKHQSSPLKTRIKRIRRNYRGSGNSYMCVECKFRAESISVLKEHLKFVHDQTKPNSFDQSSLELNLHKVKSSTPVLSNNKRGRKKVYKKRDNKTEDYRKSTFGEFICSKCNFVTDDIVFIENHMKIHSKSVSNISEIKDIFKCTFCDFETEYEKMMESHLETHTEHDSDFDFDNDSPTKKESNVSVRDGIGIVECIEEKKYRCSSCDFQSNNFKSFERHNSLHLRRDVFDIIFSSVIF